MIKKFGTNIIENFLQSSQEIALSNFEGRKYTYLQLIELSGRMAREINKRTQLHDRTIVLMERDVEAIAACVSCFLSHSIYVPLEVEDPIDRIKYIIEDSDPKVILCDDHTERRLALNAPDLLSSLTVINVSRFDWKEHNSIDGFKLEEELFSLSSLLKTKELGYMIYTSGTTGRPKGVLIPEENLNDLMEWTLDHTLAAKTKKTLQFYSHGFDPSLLEIFSTLLAAQELIIAGGHLKKDLEQLVHKIVDFKIERLFIPISLVQMIADEFQDSDLFRNNSHLKEINCGGDRMVISASLRKWVKNINNSRKEKDYLILNNQYGPTEATIMVSQESLTGDPSLWPESPSLGRPISGVDFHILGKDLLPLEYGEKGTLYIGGNLLAKEYWNNQDLTKKSFIQAPFLDNSRIYNTGDSASLNHDGTLQFFGREDHQVKINGLRVECSEVENVVRDILSENEFNYDEVVVILCHRNSRKYLVCAIRNRSLSSPIQEEDESNLILPTLKKGLVDRLPSGIRPSSIKVLNELPLSSNGKIDRAELEKIFNRDFTTNGLESIESNQEELSDGNSSHDLKEILLSQSRIVSSHSTLDYEISLFDQGLTSLQGIQLVFKLNQKLKREGFNCELHISDLYEFPILKDLENRLTQSLNPKSTEAPISKDALSQNKKNRPKNRKVAIVGVSCRFPGAENFNEFSKLILENRSALERFSLSDIIHPSQQKSKLEKNFVPARGVLKKIDYFAAEKFKISPRVAEVMDPQMRLLLEQAYDALEFAQTINRETMGVYCGMSNNTYIDQVEQLNPEKCDQVGRWNLATLNEKDYIATQVAHKLDLKGPALSIHTACSTSLVAMIQGARAIQSGECDSALCGGVHIDSRHRIGHLYQEGSIFSKDGLCSPYDEKVSGTLFSDGVGVVILKDYDLALADGNLILGTIAGCGLNNDGGHKTSFSAPSVVGQRDVISKALHEAHISLEDLSFIEGHGTATPIGDPIEVQALTKAFELRGAHLQSSNKVTLSSVKSQIGHTVAASGVAGVIKALICLNHSIEPATANFEKENPLLNLAKTPFQVLKRHKYNSSDKRRFCGVSSFGVGGTNAHIIIERGQTLSKEVKLNEEGSRPLIFPFSASSDEHLRKVLINFCKDRRESHFPFSLEELSYSLVQREMLKGPIQREFSYRAFFVAKSFEELEKKIFNEIKSTKEFKKVANISHFVMASPGQGTQYLRLGSDLYKNHKIFKELIDESCQIYREEFSIDLLPVFLNNESGLIHFTQYTQPCLFIYQYALLKLMESLGIKGDYYIGHSIGEFSLALIRGIFSLRESLKIVGIRAQLMGELPSGSMLSIRANEHLVQNYLDEFKRISKNNDTHHLSIATINSDELCVVGGEDELIQKFARFLEEKKILVRGLKTSHAFHTPSMNSILPAFESSIRTMTLKEGRGIQVPSSKQELSLSDPMYWVQHITYPVDFNSASQKLAQILENEGDKSVLIDMGPRSIMNPLLKKIPFALIAPLNRGKQESENIDLLETFGKIWNHGAEINLSKLFVNLGFAGRSPSWQYLPTPPLLRKSYWAAHPISNDEIQVNNLTYRKSLESKEDIMNTFTHEVHNFIEEKSGFSELDTQSSFLELGLDSLLLTQLAIDLKNEYEVEIGFRDLMDSIDTIEKLSEHLLEINPNLVAKFTSTQENNREIIGETKGASHSNPLTSETQKSNDISSVQEYKGENPNLDSSRKSHRPLRQPVSSMSIGGANVESIIHSQMELMKMQLEVLSGAQVSIPDSTQTTTENDSFEQSAQSTSKEVEIQSTGPSHVNKDTSDSSEEEEVKATVNTSKQAFGAQARVNTIKEKSDVNISQSVQMIIDTYCRKTAASKSYTQKYRKVNADPRVVTGFRPEVKELTYPIVVNRSKNQRLWDIDGNEYIDVTCGFGSNFFGNQNKRINEALHDQLDRGFEIGPQHELAGECAELLCELTGNERAAFCNTGSEAVLGALRISRTITGRKKVVMFKGSYHGINDEVIVRPGGKKQEGMALPAAAGINPTATKDMILLDYGTQESLNYVRKYAHELAAVIVEPVQSRRSDFRPKEFLKEIRQITQESNTAFIFDEVITGFRIALGGVQEYFGIRADLVTYGKIIGGGMPIGIVSGRSKFMDALDGGDWRFGDDSAPTTAITYFAGTFVRHPLALRALKEALLILKEGGKSLYYGINQRAQNFVDQLNLIADALDAPIKVDNFGGVLKPRFTDTGKNNDLLFALLRIEGVHCYDGFPWFVTLGHEEGDLEEVVKKWKKCILEMQRLSLFPQSTNQDYRKLDHLEKEIQIENGSSTHRDQLDRDNLMKEDRNSEVKNQVNNLGIKK